MTVRIFAGRNNSLIRLTGDDFTAPGGKVEFSENGGASYASLEFTSTFGVRFDRSSQKTVVAAKLSIQTATHDYRVLELSGQQITFMDQTFRQVCEDKMVPSTDNLVVIGLWMLMVTGGYVLLCRDREADTTRIYILGTERQPTKGGRVRLAPDDKVEHAGNCLGREYSFGDKRLVLCCKGRESYDGEPMFRLTSSYSYTFTRDKVRIVQA